MRSRCSRRWHRASHGPKCVSRAFGDIHVYGNTHYLLDPMNGIIVARTIATALVSANPEHRELYSENLDAFEKRLLALTDRLLERMKPYQGTSVVTYHRTWPYFLRRFSLENIAEVEPKPGISPGPQHIASVAEQMSQQRLRVVIVEMFSNQKIAKRVAERADAPGRGARPGGPRASGRGLLRAPL